MENLNAQNVYLAEKSVAQQKEIDELRSQVNSILVMFSKIQISPPDNWDQPGGIGFAGYTLHHQKIPHMKQIQESAKDMREKAGQEILEKMTIDDMKIKNSKTVETVLNKFPVGITGADLIKQLISQGVTIP